MIEDSNSNTNVRNKYFRCEYIRHFETRMRY